MLREDLASRTAAVAAVVASAAHPPHTHAPCAASSAFPWPSFDVRSPVSLLFPRAGRSDIERRIADAKKAATDWQAKAARLAAKRAPPVCAPVPTFFPPAFLAQQRRLSALSVFIHIFVFWNCLLPTLRPRATRTGPRTVAFARSAHPPFPAVPCALPAHLASRVSDVVPFVISPPSFTLRYPATLPSQRAAGLVQLHPLRAERSAEAGDDGPFR